MSLLANDDKGDVFRDNLRIFRAWRAQPVAIRDAQIGSDALVRGKVETNGFVERTLVTERECVAMIATFRIAHTSMDGRGFQLRGQPVARVRTTLPFFVIDANGDRLLVDDPDFVFRVDVLDVSKLLGHAGRPGSPLEAFMRARMLTMRIDTEYLAEEEVIVPGQMVEVFGRVGTTQIHEQTAYRDALSEVRTMRSKDAGSRVVVRSPPRSAA